MFRSITNNGFQIVFSNGYEIGCFFGLGNYCENKRNFDCSDLIEERRNPMNKCKNCEVAIIKGNEIVTEKILEEMGSDLVSDDPGMIGYVSADDVGKIISYLVNLKD